MLGFDGVTKRFGPLTALDRCTFTARPGRLTGFLGPNGAGKTTAMRTVFGLVEQDAGTVRWQGRPVSAAERARLRMERGADVAGLLAVLQDQADIVSFTYQPPTLSELFREAVAA
jgi:ABC-type uncharacterized transport system ATPase subunit